MCGRYDLYPSAVNSPFGPMETNPLNRDRGAAAGKRDPAPKEESYSYSFNTHNYQRHGDLGGKSALDEGGGGEDHHKTMKNLSQWQPAPRPTKLAITVAYPEDGVRIRLQKISSESYSDQSVARAKVAAFLPNSDGSLSASEVAGVHLDDVIEQVSGISYPSHEALVEALQALKGAPGAVCLTVERLVPVTLSNPSFPHHLHSHNSHHLHHPHHPLSYGSAAGGDNGEWGVTPSAVLATDSYADTSSGRHRHSSSGRRRSSDGDSKRRSRRSKSGGRSRSVEGAGADDTHGSSAAKTGSLDTEEKGAAGSEGGRDGPGKVKPDFAVLVDSRAAAAQEVTEGMSA